MMDKITLEVHYADEDNQERWRKYLEPAMNNIARTLIGNNSNNRVDVDFWKDADREE